MIGESDIRLYDRSDMYSVIRDFHDQISDAYEIGINLPVPDVAGIDKIIITGMGGSAIGGDILRSYCLYDLKLPLYVNRNYRLPAFADRNTLVIASSYSGNTEETLSAYEDARQRGCRIIALSSGGKLSIISSNDNVQQIKIPAGYQPRCALAYSFLPLLLLFGKCGFLCINDKDITSLISYISEKSAVFSDYKNPENNAVSLALHLRDRIPLIYSSCDFLDTVNLRWRSQLQENSKTLAFGNLIPEMNHNEINGWENNKEILRNFAVIILRDKEDNPRIVQRIEAMNNIIRPYVDVQIEIQSEGSSRLERLFDLVYLGDWVSYYLAILCKSDPTEIKNINILKNKLAEN